jgi:hypothetical protein
MGSEIRLHSNSQVIWLVSLHSEWDHQQLHPPQSELPTAYTSLWVNIQPFLSSELTFVIISTQTLQCPQAP